MTTTDTLLADLADVLDRASKLAAQMAETLAAPPSYWPERDGTLGELEPGDRVMWNGAWREVQDSHQCALSAARFHVSCVEDEYVCEHPTTPVRIQKRHGNVTIPDDPLREFRLPGGRVAYETVRAGEVVPGMWVERLGQWHQVVMAGACGDDRVILTMDNDMGYGCTADAKVKVASTVDASRLAAERQAQHAEAYDQACEARS